MMLSKRELSRTKKRMCLSPYFFTNSRKDRKPCKRRQEEGERRRREEGGEMREEEAIPKKSARLSLSRLAMLMSQSPSLRLPEVIGCLGFSPLLRRRRTV